MIRSALMNVMTSAALKAGRGLKRDVAGKHHHRNAAVADRLADGDLEDARHLPWFGDEFAIAAAFLEQRLRMGFLEITCADLRRRICVAIASTGTRER